MFQIISLAMNEVFFYVSRIFRFATSQYHLKAVFFIGVGVAVLFVVIKVIKSISWGK